MADHITNGAHSAFDDETKEKSMPPQETMFDSHAVGETDYTDVEKQKAAEGNAHFHRLGWKRLTVVLLVEAIALGCLSLPSAFATLGMVPGVIICIAMGFIAIYTSDIVGQIKLKFPHVSHYADAGQLLMGRFGYELVGFMFSMLLILLTGGHCLTGTIAFNTLTDNGACSVAFGVVSMIILLILSIPPSFTELAILGYIDFVSIVVAVGITMIATGIDATNHGGAAHSGWTAFPKDGLTFTDAFVAVTDIALAYSFAICQFSFMDEMHTIRDYKKSIWALGLIEIVIYTCTGAIIYAFVGPEVQSPALLSASPIVSKVAFGIALPVIFVSGAINVTVVGRYIHGRYYKDSIIRFINTKMGWITWLALLAIICILAFVIAEAIPFFNDLVSIISALFVSGFTFYFPAMLWFKCLREGSVFARHNIVKTIANAIIFIIGMIILVGGTYASVDDIIINYRSGSYGKPFSCSSS